MLNFYVSYYDVEFGSLHNYVVNDLLTSMLIFIHHIVIPIKYEKKHLTLLNINIKPY